MIRVRAISGRGSKMTPFGLVVPVGSRLRDGPVEAPSGTWAVIFLPEITLEQRVCRAR